MNKNLNQSNEAKRLDDLKSYDILNQIEQSDYDFLTKMASQICNTKISLISLITEDKQWFLSHEGLDTRETPREFAFCSHAIESPKDIFIIEDSREDNRFKNNPLVTGEPNVIFYAGVPLISKKGYSLGTLCVIDDKPKQLNEDQIESLKLLRNQVMQVLELRKKTIEVNRLNNELSKTTKIFNESQKFNNIGAWELDLNTNKTHWTDEVYAIHELPLDYEHNFEKAIKFYHEDDRNLIDKTLRNVLSTGENFDITCRLITAKNNIKWVRTTGIKWTEDPENPKLIGSFQDVTKSKLSKEKLEKTLAENQAVFDASTHVTIVTTDISGIITRFNKGAEINLGYKAEEVVGKHTPVIFHQEEEIEELKEQFFKPSNEKIEDFKTLTSNVKLNTTDTKSWTHVRKDKSTYPVLMTVSPIKKNNEITGFLGIGINISEIKKAERYILSLLKISDNQVNRLRNFADIVTHNLRSHSGGISMLLDLLKDESPNIYNNENIQYLKGASDNLTNTIKHLTDIVQTNLESSQDYIVINLKTVVDYNINSLLSLARNNQVIIKNNISDDMQVFGLAAYVDSITVNFLTNGIKYASKERDSFVEVSAEKKDDYTVLIFKDNGLGIDLKKNKEKLFGLHKTFHSHKDSRGIGLFITRNQIEAMGGHVEVESEVNVGTTFKVFLKNS
ncbi:hypothetical protein ULMS_08570 [Patiriisocius marinistellae]|uniref:histidine kinase n=1 Tax=Patiriisocius marinistellae TaxID=2494560 RepID=A0A5J4FYX8_9FLAO|nr:PAS domain S-box protein [Patiriisocius marinistellae]GEQ85349.1 hypothetical protein ULMS_08570 [Patiriisocius marinistellae]